jgi:hypothetical protein
MKPSINEIVGRPRTKKEEQELKRLMNELCNTMEGKA